MQKFHYRAMHAEPATVKVDAKQEKQVVGPTPPEMLLR
jgi:hypothetical protein